MQAPISKGIRKLLSNPLYAQKISEALVTGKPVLIINQAGQKPKIKRIMRYPKKEKIEDYPSEDVVEVNLD